jgi:hypothetical protein
MHKVPEFAPVYFLEWQEGLDQEMLVSEGLRWMSAHPNGRRGILATEASHGLELVPKALAKSLDSIHTKNRGATPSAAGRPILVMFPLRELLLKLTSRQLQRAAAVCVLTYGATDVPFLSHWLDRMGAENLATGGKRTVTERSALDPVVEAAFMSLRGSLLGQLTGPQHDYDPNGITTMLELQRQGHELDADKLAAWASVQGYSEHQITDFIDHVAKVRRGHRYTKRTIGTWTPNYARWVELADSRDGQEVGT